MIVFRKLSFYFAMVGIAGAVAIVIHLSAAEPMLSPPVQPPAKPAARAIAAAGLVEARGENTSIGVPMPGLVTEVYVKVWDRIDKGQPLFRLDDRDLRATLLTQEANVTVAEATLHRLEPQYKRLRRLVESHAVSEQEVETREHDIRVAEAQLNAARAGVAQTNAMIERLVVRSPIAGTILQVNIRPGEYASPTTSRPPMVLGHIDEVQIRADVDEQLAPRVRAGQRAVGYLKGDSVHPIALEFVRIEPYVVPKVSLTGSTIERVDTRVLQVIYTFKNSPEYPVYIGQQMDVYFEEAGVERHQVNLTHGQTTNPQAQRIHTRLCDHP